MGSKTQTSCWEATVHSDESPTSLQKQVFTITPAVSHCETNPHEKTIWANQPIHSFLVECLNPCLQGTSVRVGSPQHMKAWKVSMETSDFNNWINKELWQSQGVMSQTGTWRCKLDPQKPTLSSIGKSCALGLNVDLAARPSPFLLVLFFAFLPPLLIALLGGPSLVDPSLLALLDLHWE